MVYRLQVLGRFRLLAPAGEEIALASKKAQALLAMLALAQGKAVPRERLISTLWADRGEDQARSSLRQALTAIRKALQASSVDELLRTADAGVSLDTTMYESDLPRLEPLESSGDADALGEAIALLDTELLDGLGLRDAAIEDWLSAERKRFRDIKTGLLKRQADILRSKGKTDRAIAAARSLIHLDPLDEDAHRLLMRLLATKGDRVAALKHYKTCAETLKAELGIEPAVETRQLHDEIKTQSRQELPAQTQLATPAGKLAIAVLPFAAPGGDAREERLADALTRELIAELGHFSPLEVASAVSSFAFKGRPINLADIRRELGARYLVEGSAEIAGSRVRVMAQLTDIEKSRQIWARRYDADTGDGFLFRDELVAGIASNLYHPLMDHALRETLYHPPAAEGSADLYSRLFHLSNFPSEDTQALARELCFRLIAADPGHALVYESLSWTYLHDAINAWTDDLAEALRLAREAAVRGIAIDQNEPYVRCALAHVEIFQGRHPHAREELETALRISPSDGIIAALVAGAYAMLGNCREALEQVEIARRRSPDYNFIPLSEGLARHMGGNVAEAFHPLERFLVSNPDYDLTEAHLAACHAELGDLTSARQAVERLTARNSRLTRAHVARLYAPLNATFVQRMIAALETAGLP